MDMPMRPVTPLVVDGRLRDRVTAAVLAQAGLRHDALNAFLRERLAGVDTDGGALLTEPVIEGAAGYVGSGKTPADLSGTLLHPKLAAALEGRPGDESRFNHPAYAHQIEAWQHLTAKDVRSVLVSSGTGSGKTECFLVPLLDDLAREVDRSGRLTGVRALMLYPLNALIASQEERLRRWIAPFGGDIRFALYNGQMTDSRRETRERAEEDFPAQVLYRRTLRDDPPPVLVTNNTMLEYMTIRKEDAPIVQASQGLLRWIVIDEAHSYVGSAAAEVALLLRRVLQTFGVTAEQVRFVATSATIGGSDNKAAENLRRFLADLAGVPLAQVRVVLGQRERTALPPATTLGQPADVRSPDFNAHQAVQAFVREAEDKPLSMNDVRRHALAAGVDAASLIEAVALPGSHQERPLLPLRVHQFIRAIPGLWTCFNPACTGSRPTGWPFGGIAFQREEACRHCGGLMFEILSCSECGEPWLNAFDHGGHLLPAATAFDADEFAAATARETEDADDDEDEAPRAANARVGHQRLVGVRPLAGLQERAVDPLTGGLPERRSAGIPIWISRPTLDGSCPCALCHAAQRPGKSGPLWPFRFGAPFLIQNATPTMLEGVSRSSRTGVELPAGGRQLISFTDSRQGTARFAANIETSSERSYVRGFIYHAAQKAAAPPPDLSPDLRTELEAKRATYLQFNDPLLAGVLADIEKKLTGVAEAVAVPWLTIVRDLAAEPIVSQWIGQVWDDDRDPRFHNNPGVLAHYLLLRELARRPRRANSVETLGFAKLAFPPIDTLSAASVSSALTRRGVSLSDWRDYLYYLVDSVIRAKFVLNVTWDDARWLLPRDAILRHIVGPGDDTRVPSDVSWPRAWAGGVKTNAVILLEQALGLHSDSAEDRSVIDDVLRTAWDQVRPLLEGSGSTLALVMERVHIAPVRQAWLCPVTHGVLPRLALGRTPYGLRGNPPGADARPIELHFPSLKLIFPNSDAERERAAASLAADPDVASLKQRGVWSNLHDRAATLAPYIRAEEHSAQQPPFRLRSFEGQFKRGEINLLACSTTMEMGVDIGSIEAVLNTNVPPSIANYRQRVGRAGRRGQGFASSLTFARDTPLDREAFLNPVTYLRRQLRPPIVKLDSRRIVQRHANALLLAQWFKDASGELKRVKAGDFLGYPQGLTLPPVDRPPVTQFCEWLGKPSTAAAMAPRLAALTAGTALGGSGSILTNAAEAFAEVRTAFGSEWQSLRGQSTSLADDGRKGLEIQIRRMCLEPLLKELADRSLLPGHGFPNAVVPLITDCADMIGRRGRRQDEEGETPRNRRYDYPSRNAAVAIREYAPGAETVVDGLVWMSAGVTLNWQRPAHEDNAREVQSIRWSWQCAECGEADCARFMTQNCSICGSANIDNRQFIEPAGFRVDWRSKPHAQADRIDYIEPEPAIVSAREASWQPLLDPRLGRGRATANGLVFHHSRGRNKQGYRICLDCGRAAEEGSPTLDDHDALMPQRSGTWRCTGNDKTYAITRPLALGHEILTDVAELQPALLTSEGAAWALVSALREALSRRLGIEPRELGLAVACRTGVLGERVFSVYLYDQSAGGAGYAPRLLDDFAAILREAQQVLECPTDCKTGCSACVLVADLFAQQSRIDRRAALACVLATRAAMAGPSAEDVVGPGCRLSRPIADAIARQADGGGIVAIWASAGFDLAALGAPPLSVAFAQAAANGMTTRLVLPPGALGNLDFITLAGLRDASHRHRFLIWTANPVVAPNGAQMLASVQAGGNVSGFFSRDANAGILGPGWGVGSEHPVVEMPCAAWPAMVRVEPEALERPSRPEDRVCIIKADPGRPIRQFGAQFVARILQPELEFAGLWKPGRLVSISYSDRYLKAPLPVTLLMHVVSALRDKLSSKRDSITLSIDTERLRDDRYGGAPSKIGNNWQNEQDRTDTVHAMAEHLLFKCAYINSQATHARKLTLCYDDGSTVVILYDQGFGYWRAVSGDRHDFRAKPVQQAKALFNSSAFVQGSGESYIAITRA